MLPTPPTDPALVRAPLLYLFGVAPSTQAPDFGHVLVIVDRWLAGDDPFPDPPPDPPTPGPQPPDPNPPPVPAYPIGVLLEELAELDAATMAPAWATVREAFAAWLTSGPFA
jgi:hypothetical protein